MSGAEFRNAMFNIGLEYMGNHIDALFTSWDFTGDGMISYSELEYALKTKPVRVPPLHTHAHLSRTPITHTTRPPPRVYHPRVYLACISRVYLETRLQYTSIPTITAHEGVSAPLRESLHTRVVIVR